MGKGYFKVDHENGTKQCADCEQVKPIDGFPVRKTGYVYAYCKVCNSRRAGEWKTKNRERATRTNAEWVAKNPERHTAARRNAHYQRRYGIGLEVVMGLLEKQLFRCAICQCGISESTLVVDHCHGSGAVRGLLCNRCNISLAPLERPGFFDAAIAYLESHRSRS